MNKKCIFIIFVACILVLGACFSAWRGDEGTISISIGGGEAIGRAAGGAAAGGTGVTDAGDEPATDGEGGFPWPSTQPPSSNEGDPWAIESHTITLSGGPGPNQEQSHIKGGKTVQFSVAPGQWTITVKCFLEDKDGVDYDHSYAEGSRTVNIKPGPNGVIVIPMSIKVIEGDDNPNSGKAGTLRWAIEDVVQMSKKNIDIVIDLPEGDNEIILKGKFPPIAGKSVTIRTKKDVTIKREYFSESFFTIGEEGTLILGGTDSAEITIDGGNKPATSTSSNGILANAPLITVNGGALIMNKDVTLQNNTNNNGKGGGVSVLNGTFTMKGGTIKGNTAAGTGTATSGGFGGGVYVGEEGNFSKTGGIIYGCNDSDKPTPIDNTTKNANNGIANQGNAVYVAKNDSENRLEDKYRNKNVDYDLDSKEPWPEEE